MRNERAAELVRGAAALLGRGLRGSGIGMIGLAWRQHCTDLDSKETLGRRIEKTGKGIALR
jgi:hypothetical protein